MNNQLATIEVNPSQIDCNPVNQIIIELVTIQLWQLINLPIAKIRIKEHLGIVYLVEFTPHSKTDPIIPVVLADMGQRYNIIFDAYVNHLLDWTSYCNQQKWSNEVKRLLQELFKAIDRNVNRLTSQEINYLKLKLAYTIAMPNETH